jgi:sugar diacid utilization regulator
VITEQAPRDLFVTDPIRFPSRTFLAPIVIGKAVVGRLWVLGADTELQALERRGLEHGVTVVSLELLKQHTAAAVEERLSGELLGDLLSDRPLDQGVLRARALHLGHDLSVRRAAIVFRLDNPSDDSEPSIEEWTGRTRRLRSLVASTVRRRGVDGLVGERDHAVVALVADRDGRGEAMVDQLAESVRRDARAYVAQGSVSVAVGPWADDVVDFRRSYRIASGALALAQRQGGRDRVVTLEGLGVYGLMLTVERLDQLAAFARRTLEPLRTYDERKSSELVETVRAYLANSCRASETAASLVVHPNTVAYRIRRIESLLEMDLSQPHAQLQLQLALIVDEIAGEHTALGAPS